MRYLQGPIESKRGLPKQRWRLEDPVRQRAKPEVQLWIVRCGVPGRKCLLSEPWTLEWRQWERWAREKLQDPPSQRRRNPVLAGRRWKLSPVVPSVPTRPRSHRSLRSLLDGLTFGGRWSCSVVSTRTLTDPRLMSFASFSTGASKRLCLVANASCFLLFFDPVSGGGVGGLMVGSTARISSGSRAGSEDGSNREGPEGSP